MMPRRYLLLAMLLVFSWCGLSAEEAQQIATGDYVRLRAPSIYSVRIQGGVISFDSDSLVLEHQTSPFHSERLAIHVRDIEGLERKTASTGQWETLSILQAGDSIVQIPGLALPQRLPRVLPDREMCFSGGIGASSIADGFSSGLGVSYHHNRKHIISLRYVRSIPFMMFGESYDVEEKATEIGILYGRVLQGYVGMASLAVGIGRVAGIRRGKFLRYESKTGWFLGSYTRDYAIHEERKFDTIAIPIEAQLFWLPLDVKAIDHIGIGFYGFGNINSEKSYWGVLLCLNLGKAR